MNDKEIDTLLEEIKGCSPNTMDSRSEEAIVAGLHAGIRRQRRNTIALSLGVLLVLLAGVFSWRSLLKDDTQNIVERQWRDCAKLMLVHDLFPETGVALVNGELITFEHEEKKAGDIYLRLCMHRLNGKVPVTFDVIVEDNDYITLKEGPITGEIFVNRCSESEVIVDVDLVFICPDGKKQEIKQTVPMFPIGIGCARASVPEDYVLEFYMDTLNKG